VRHSISPAYPDHVTLTDEGFKLFFILLAFAAVGFVLALARRSWPLWLVALTCTVLALATAYTHREDQAVARVTGVSP
jgi:hypothetical protein